MSRKPKSACNAKGGEFMTRDLEQNTTEKVVSMPTSHHD